MPKGTVAAMTQLPEFENLTVTVADTIGRLTLDRPHKRNALSVDLLDEIAEAARWFDGHDEIRVVVVSGAGDHFCAGADVAAFGGQPAVRHAGDAGRIMADALEAMRQLSIVVLRGWCVGGGVVLAAACDLRIAADDARFSIPEVDLGIPLAWGGIPRLVREIGPARTKELVVTCRPFDAAEAEAIGFVNRTVPADQLDAEVESLARSIAAKAPLAVQATKVHTNAVTDQMVGTGRAWNDVDSLFTALHDEDCKAARLDYLGRLGRA